MKKFLISVFFINLLLIVCGLSCFAVAPSSDYELLIKDDFEGNSLNTDIWAYRTGTANGGTNKIENVRVENGKLYFDYILKDGVFTCAGVISLDNLGYGYYETKAKSFDGANGFHTSFWTSGSPGNAVAPYHPKSNGVMEIDCFEMDSNETETAPVPYYNLHYWWAEHVGIGGGRFDINSDGDESTADWFTAGFEWLPGLIIYYANGEEIGRNKTDVYGLTHAKLTSLAMPDKLTDINGNIDIDISKADENGYFGSSEYEYFTYYQKRLKNVNLLGNGHFEFNRQNGSKPKNLYYEGNAEIEFTPYAYEGYCAAVLSDEALIGQYFAYLLDGNYTLGGYFKTKENTQARLVVYDKDGSELKSMAIPKCDDWTYISMPDVNVENSAFAVVETLSGQIQIDNLEFYCQEGDDSYTSYKDSDYSNYSVLSNSSNYITLAREDAEKSNHAWRTSSAANIDNYYAYATTNPSAENYYKNMWSKYTITVKETGYHDLELLRVLYNNNPPSQSYTITLDGELICDPVSVSTYAEEPSADWIKLCTVYANKGQKLEVTMTCDDYSATGSKCVRVLPMQLAAHSIKLMETAIIAQINNPVFQHCNSPYAFDKTDSNVCPIYVSEEIYIPYQAIKNILKLEDIPDDTAYISISKIEQNKDFSVTKNNNLIIIHKSEFFPNDTALAMAYKSLSTFRTFQRTVNDAVYIGTAEQPREEIHTTDECFLAKNWGKSSLGYNSSSLYSSSDGAEALWLVTPNKKQTYSVQIYSIAHNGANSTSTPSTTIAGADVTVGDKIYTCYLNQYNGKTGWYDLGLFELSENSLVAIKLYNIAKDGHLRACAVRFVPALNEPTFVGNFDIYGQEITDYNEATKTGTWKPSGGALSGCYYGSENAKITWAPTPSSSQKYSIQLFSPCYNQNATTLDAIVTLTIDGTENQFVLNQRKETADFMGWYDLGTYDLTTDSAISISANQGSGGYLRAKCVRLVPISHEAFATKTSSGIIFNTGIINSKNSTVLYKEYDSKGRIIKTEFFDSPQSFINIPMQSTENSCKIFIWKDIFTITPIKSAIEIN